MLAYTKGLPRHELVYNFYKLNINDVIFLYIPSFPIYPLTYVGGPFPYERPSPSQKLNIFFGAI
jgi:hypothetical protein